MYYTENELAKLIESVEKEFRSDLAKAEAEHTTLAKAEDSEAPAKEKPEEREEKPEQKEEEHAEKEQEQSHAPEKEAAPPQEEGEAPKEEHEMPPAEHAEAGMEANGHDYDEEDLEHMHKMYMSMSPGEQRAHHDALRKCMDASMAKAEKEIEQETPGHLPGKRSEASAAHGEKLPLKKGENPRRGSGGQESRQEPANSPGPKSEASYTKNKELYKSDEDGIEEQQPNNTPGAKSEASYTPNKELYDMGKSEDFEMLKSEMEVQKAKAETLQKTLDNVTEFLTKLAKKATVPQGKAVTSYEVIAKSEDSEVKPMTKSEVLSILSKKASDPSLSKSDREAINSFYLNNASFNSISHLLK
jgi:hypothetical protein